MTPSYVIEVAHRAEGPVALFINLKTGRFKLLPIQDDRFEKTVDVLGIRSCVGVYNDQCPLPWIEADLRHATRNMTEESEA